MVQGSEDIKRPGIERVATLVFARSAVEGPLDLHVVPIERPDMIVSSPRFSAISREG